MSATEVVFHECTFTFTFTIVQKKTGIKYRPCPCMCWALLPALSPSSSGCQVRISPSGTAAQTFNNTRGLLTSKHFLVMKVCNVGLCPWTGEILAGCPSRRVVIIIKSYRNLPKTYQKWKKRSEACKHCALTVVGWSQIFFAPPQTPYWGRGTAKI